MRNLFKKLTWLLYRKRQELKYYEEWSVKVKSDYQKRLRGA